VAVLEQVDPDAMDRDDMARWLDTTDRLAVRLRAVADAAAEALGLIMEGDRLILPGLPPITRVMRGGGRRQFDNDRLRSHVLRRGRERAAAVSPAVDRDTGEVVPTWDQAVAFVGDVYRLSGDNVRVTALKDLDVNIGEFCEVAPRYAVARVER
jgi:hypothetical protein